MIHLIGLPHTPFRTDLSYSCAYTTKAINWTKVLAACGEDVTVYWGGTHQPEDLHGEFVSCSSSEDQYNLWGQFDPGDTPKITWEWTEPRWLTYVARVLSELQPRVSDGDVIAYWSGIPFKTIHAWARERGKLATVEPAVGYDGIAWQENHCAFESSAWMHTVYQHKGIVDGRFMDRVIPGYADPDLFQIRARAKQPYALFLGRMISRKGPHVASDIAKRAGLKFIAAGTGGDFDAKTSRVTTEDGQPFKVDSWMGAADPALRAKLLAQATVVLMPTLYIEPFGTVHVEALLSGTPVIASPFGAFHETLALAHGGHRMSTIKDAVRAVERLAALDRADIRRSALGLFTPSAVAPETQRWLDDVRQIAMEPRGWYA